MVRLRSVLCSSAIAFVASTANPLAAQSVAEKQDDAWTFNFYLENDLFGDTDRDYTNGMRFSWVTPNLESYRHDPRMPAVVNRINDRFDSLLGLKDTETRNVVISLGQLMFTPESIEARELLEDERPYAGYLYLGFGYHGRTQNRLDSVEVNLGIVGPSSLAENSQDLIHDLRGLDKFQGWDNQLKDEPTLQLVYENKLRLFRQSLPFGLEHDFISHAGGALGSVAVYLNAGGEYRFGWELPDDFGTSAVRPAGDNSAPGRGDIRLKPEKNLFYGLHGFISLDGRAVARDIFLDGNTWKDSHSIDKEYFVGEIAIGFSFLVRQWKFSYAQVFRSREFHGQKHHHEYGSMTLSYTW
jgi:lipid A 3-O-deacylase